MKMIILILQISLYGNAFAGQERGGGREVERDFVKMARFAAKAIENTQKSGSRLFDGFNLQAFNNAIDQVEVVALAKVCVPDAIDLTTGGTVWGRCMDAQFLQNQNRIEFDENIWYEKPCLEQVALTVHEYGRASKNENGNYKYSSLVDRMDIRNSCEERYRQKAAAAPFKGYVKKCRRNPIDGRGPLTSIYLETLDSSGRAYTQLNTLNVPMGGLEEALATRSCEELRNRLISQGYAPTETVKLK